MAADAHRLATQIRREYQRWQRARVNPRRTFSYAQMLIAWGIADKDVPQAREADAEPLAGNALGGMRILAVEDDAAMLELLTRVLTEYGADVTSTTSAAAALQVLSGTKRFDLLLSDIGLPEMDGYELLRAVRKRYSAEDLPAIAATAFSREQERALAVEVGFQAYVTKPYEVAKVVGLARKLGKERERSRCDV